MQAFLSWLPRIVSILGQIAGFLAALSGYLTNAAAVAAVESGAMSAADGAGEVAIGTNWMSGGLLTFVVSTAIPFIAKFIGTNIRDRGGLKPGYVAAIDRAALETLIQTRVGRPTDAPHIESLLLSAQKIEFDATVAPLRASLVKVAPELT